MIKRVFLHGIVPGTYYNCFSSLSCGLKKSLGCERWQLEVHTCPKPPNSNLACTHSVLKKEKETEDEGVGFTSMKTFNGNGNS